MMLGERYDRQERIPGWNQKKLKKAKVSVMGSDALANFVTTALTALGIGYIKIFDNQKIREKGEEFLYFNSPVGKSRVEALEEILTKINPLVKVDGISWKMMYDSSTTLFHEENVIIDATNDPTSKEITLTYGQKSGTPVIVASTNQTWGELMVVQPGDALLEKHLLKEYCGKRQGNIPSTVIGALLVEEAKKMIMPLNETDTPTKKRLTYQAPYTNSNLQSDIGEGYCGRKKVLVVGAGSLGNFASLNLALTGTNQITIIDDDTVEEANLNRQILFYDAVGRPKSEALTEKLKQINPKIEIKSIVGLVDENFENYLRKQNFDLIMDCVDNFKTRALLNDFATKYKIPLISGGTDAKSGQVITYYPGLTTCLDCQIKIKKLAREAAKQETHSCLREPDPSVIITNQAIGGMMAGETKTALNPTKYEPTNGIIKYASNQSKRLGIMANNTKCECHNKKNINIGGLKRIWQEINS